MNALPAQPDVRAAVAICGFASSASAAAQKTFGRFAFLAPLLSGWLWLFNRRRFGKDANQNSLRSLRASNQPLLLLYGGQDLTVRYRGKRRAHPQGRRAQGEHEVHLYPEKGHNAYLSDRAQRAMYEQFGAIPKEIRSDRAKLKDYYASLRLSAADGRGSAGPCRRSPLFWTAVCQPAISLPYARSAARGSSPLFRKKIPRLSNFRSAAGDRFLMSYP